MFGDRASVLETLKRVDERLQSDGYRGAPIPLILLGGSAVLLAYGGRRATWDVDVLVPGRRLLGAGFLEQYGLSLVPEGILNLHPDFMDRLEPVPEAGDLKHLAARVLGPYDLAITKIGRGSERDIADCVHIWKAGRLSNVTEAARRWGGAKGVRSLSARTGLVLPPVVAYPRDYLKALFHRRRQAVSPSGARLP